MKKAPCHEARGQNLFTAYLWSVSPEASHLLGRYLPATIYGCVGKYTGRKRKQVGIECTAAERLEIQFDYDFFREALEEEMDRFFSAFLIKNGIFPPEGKERDELPPPREISREEALKLEALMMGMDHHTRRAALESGVER